MSSIGRNAGPGFQPGRLPRKHSHEGATENDDHDGFPWSEPVVVTVVSVVSVVFVVVACVTRKLGWGLPPER